MGKRERRTNEKEEKVGKLNKGDWDDGKIEGGDRGERGKGRRWKKGRGVMRSVLTFILISILH